MCPIPTALYLVLAGTLIDHNLLAGSLLLIITRWASGGFCAAAGCERGGVLSPAERRGRVC